MVRMGGSREAEEKISPTRFELVTLRLSNYSLTLFQLSYGEDRFSPSHRDTFLPTEIVSLPPSDRPRAEWG